MKFKKEAKKHLAEYKINFLNENDCGEYKNNKTNYPYILPEKLKEKNILKSDYYDEIQKKIKNDNVKIHKDFHHLNSSQAMCLNLFYPIVIEEKYNILSDILDVSFDYILNSCFEYVEDKKEQTNFDFYIEDKNQKLYCEVKYTEGNFAAEKKDESHIKKYENLYQERLKLFKHVGIDDFIKNYQLFRNLIYISKGIVVFIIPGIRKDLRRSIELLCGKYLSEEQQNRIRVIAIETITDFIIENDKQLKKHYVMFRDKYIFWNNTIIKNQTNM